MTAEATADLVVIGGGPAGISAATAGASHGLSVVLLDENAEPGGQIYRAPYPALAAAMPPSPERRRGDALRQALAASPVERHGGARVWFVEPGHRIGAVVGDTPRLWKTDRVLLASGAMERILPVQGWTLPGVVGLAAATVLLKAQGVLPGRRTVVAGAGPLLYAVAAGILKAGGEVAAVIDARSAGDWLALLPRLARVPVNLARGLAWQADLKRRGIPVLRRHALVRIEGDGKAETAVAVRVDRDGKPIPGTERRIAGDAVALGNGLQPGVELADLFGAKLAWDPGRGGWAPELDERCRTSVPGVYAAGDGAGIRGALAAEMQGTLAGLSIAADAGRLDARSLATAAAPVEASLGGAARFGAAVGSLCTARPHETDLIAPETVVCRCEDITRAEIDSVLDAGARDVNQVKMWTRCGMGPCQGRLCGDAVASLVAARVGGRQAAGRWTPRVPIRPVQVAALTGDFAYEDLLAAMPPPVAT